jgi:hypothetical protein
VLEEPPPEAGVDGVPPEPVDVPPTDGVAPGLGAGRPEGAAGVAAPVPGAAGVPGFIPLLDGGVGCELGARFRMSWAAPVKVRGGVDVEPGVVPAAVRPAIGGVLVEGASYAGEVGPEAIDRWDWLPLLKKRTASIPSANAPPAKTIGCRRANPSASARS